MEAKGEKGVLARKEPYGQTRLPGETGLSPGGVIRPFFWAWNGKIKGGWSLGKARKFWTKGLIGKDRGTRGPLGRAKTEGNQFGPFPFPAKEGVVKEERELTGKGSLGRRRPDKGRIPGFKIKGKSSLNIGFKKERHWARTLGSRSKIWVGQNSKGA